MSTVEFLAVNVDECEACPDGLALRFKRAGATVEVARVRYESDEGVAGWWRVYAQHEGDGDGEAERVGPAEATLVEDSSEGTVRLVRGGSRGLRLVFDEPGPHAGAEARVPYLLLAEGAALE